MPNALQLAGALSEPTNFAPLHTNRIFTGLWTNRSLLRDAATSDYQEHYGMGRQDSIIDGYNSEISSKLTLRRRPGSTVFNATVIPPVKRFYSFNTFTLTDEKIRIMADTALAVYDITDGAAVSIFTKSAGAQSTYFLSIGNTLYFTNGVDNKQWIYDPTTGTGTIADWGVDAPTDAPTVFQGTRPNPYASWQPNSGFCVFGIFGFLIPIVDPNNNIQSWDGTPNPAQTGPSEPPVWHSTGLNPTTGDGSVLWRFGGAAAWQANFGGYIEGSFITGIANTTTGPQLMMFQNISNALGNSGPIEPHWNAALGSSTPDGPKMWKNIGPALTWDSFGPNCPMFGTDTILDPNGYTEQILGPGKTGPTVIFSQQPGAFTLDGSATWNNTGPFAVAATAPRYYGYAYEMSATVDISNMSPPSLPIVVIEGNQVTVQGVGSGQAGVDIIPIYRTAAGGSTFLFLDQIPNPGAGVIWTYIDTIPDSGLNTEIQAQRTGEGTPLPTGATCLGYHLTRTFAAVGNVIWVSSGPDAVVGGSSGNAGFDTQLVVQSKITHFWACSLGMIVFTVRDAYIVLGSATDSDPLYVVVFIENLPLRSYDCFTVNKTTPYLLMGNNQLVALDPSAGIMEIGFPIADLLEEEYDAGASYVTFHAQSSREAALYVGNGAMKPNPIEGQPPVPATGQWYRMAQNNAPEQGSAWSTKAQLAGLNMGCVQSVEVNPGVYRLLISGTAAGQIWQRDLTKNTDNGNKFAVQTILGNIVLALPGQLAALFFITLESVKTGTRAGLALLLGEISGTFEQLKRTRQDPTNLPPSNTLFSDRYHFAQSQKEAWCRHFQMEITWPAEDASNELLTFTIFGQTWQEMRSQ